MCVRLIYMRAFVNICCGYLGNLNTIMYQYSLGQYWLMVATKHEPKSDTNPRIMSYI